jgi:hypothetical protein
MMSYLHPSLCATVQKRDPCTAIDSSLLVLVAMPDAAWHLRNARAFEHLIETVRDIISTKTANVALVSAACGVSIIQRRSAALLFLRGWYRGAQDSPKPARYSSLASLHKTRQRPRAVAGKGAL